MAAKISAFFVNFCTLTGQSQPTKTKKGERDRLASGKKSADTTIE